MNTTKHSRFAPAARMARAQQHVAIAQAAYEHAQADALPVLVAELRAHGNVHKACETANVPHSSFCKWRVRDAALDHDVRLAMQFAKSDAVDFAKWVTL